MSETESGGPNFSFLQGLKMDSLVLEQEWRKNSNGIFCGPLYHTRTSNGEPLDISVCYFDSFFPTGRLRNYYLFGIDSQLGIVARKNSNIDFRENPAIATGRLVTAYKEKGYGTALELVQNDLFQREADQSGELVWVITDRNNELLYIADKEHREEPTDSTRLALEIAKLEHDRWNSIYHRFGGEFHPDRYEPKYLVHYKPKSGKEISMGLIKDCTLERKGNRAVPTLFKFYSNDKEKERVRIERIKQILKIIQPKK